MGDRIGVPLDLDGFDVGNCEVVDGVLQIEVRSTLRAACHHCGSLDVTPHATPLRRIRDRSCGYPVVLLWTQRRFACSDCARTCRERHPEVAGRRSVTHRFRRLLFEASCGQPSSEVAAAESVSHYRVAEAFEHHALDELLAQEVVPPRVLSIDESAFRKRFHFHTVLSDPERGRVIDLAEGRGKGAVFEGIARMDDQVRAAIETVVMDCHWPYRRAVEEALPRALIVADKFHVIRSVDAAAQRVRKRLGKRTYRQRIGHLGGISRQHNPANNPTIYRARWVFMKRAHKLSEDERAWLEEVFDASLDELRLAWLLKEQFAAIYDADDRTEGERRLDAWIDHICRAGLPEFLNTWRTLSHWRDEILNYLDDPVTNAFAEGITNKIKVMKRRSYGFRDPIRYRQRVLLNCRRRSSRHG